MSLPQTTGNDATGVRRSRTTTTLSDLLADDVRYYFLREPSASNYQKRQRRGSSSDSSRKDNLSRATSLTIQSISSRFNDHEEIYNSDNYEERSRMEQIQGEDTAERHDTKAISPVIANAVSQKRQQQFRAQHRHRQDYGTSGKHKYLSPDDAEFLQHYAKEKERASSRRTSSSSSPKYMGRSSSSSQSPTLPLVDNIRSNRKEIKRISNIYDGDARTAVATAIRSSYDRINHQPQSIGSLRSEYEGRAMLPQSQQNNQRDASSQYQTFTKSKHKRDDSLGTNSLVTFVRVNSYSPARSITLRDSDGSNSSCHINDYNNPRPVYYLSASDSSCDCDNDIPSNKRMARNQIPKVSSTSSINYSSTDGSDWNSTLRGDGIINSHESFALSKFYRANKINQHVSGWQGGNKSNESSSSDESSSSSSSSSHSSSDSPSNFYDEVEKQPLFVRGTQQQEWRKNHITPKSERNSLLGGGTNSLSIGRAHTSKELRNITNNHDGRRLFSSDKRRRKKKKIQNKYRRLERPGCPLRLEDVFEVLSTKICDILIVIELFISNMPALVGSLALAWCSLGVDWFKWYEETYDTCHPIHYHSNACVFPEFPGCYACDTDNYGYKFALHFHYSCSVISFVLCSFLLGKIMIAFPVVRDELANPTTAAPIGLLCMAVEKVFGGSLGPVGMCITFFASAVHTVVACWFIFISVIYKTLPEPSWFPNTTGIGLAAVKVYLYWTDGGYFLSIFALVTFIMFYFLSLYRIHTNEKISVPVCWAQLSGPAVALYGFTLFSQPGTRADDNALFIPENEEHYYRIHRQYYMPILHVLFVLCMISMVSSMYLLISRYKSFRQKEFSPAHLSFCAPLVSHTNALQVYRSSLDAFTSPTSEIIFKLLLYRYWVFSLICGTLLVFVMTWKFCVHLPNWCHLNVEQDELPPEPEHTLVTKLLQDGSSGDSMKQNFVSAAVLQANESGALIRVLNKDGRMKYVRSRRMQSIGFDPIMNVAEFISERDRLLQHVTYSANPSRDRGGIISFDGTLMDTNSHTSGRRGLNFLSFDASTIMRGGS